MVTNVELDHHATWALGRAERRLRGVRGAGGGAGRSGRGRSCRARRARSASASSDAEQLTFTAGGSRFAVDGVDGRAPGARRAQRPQRPRGARGAGRSPACRLEEAARRRSPSFPGAGRRFEEHGRTPRGALVYDDYAHHPTEVRATLEAARELEPRAPDRRLPAAPLLAHPGARRATSARALALADEVVRARRLPRRARSREDFAGVSGLLVAEAAADAAGGRPVWWLPRPRGRPSAACARRAARGRPAGHDRRRRRGSSWPGRLAAMSARRRGVERDYPLARLTTVRAGGHGRLLRPPGFAEDELVELLAWAAAERAPRSGWSARARTCW